MRIYLDSSALVKRYIDEPGTAKVLDWCERATELASSTIAVPEVISAFCRLQREARIPEFRYQYLKASLFADIEDAELVDLTPSVLLKTITCLEANGLRGMDAIHVGSALVLGVDVFLSADSRQIKAAQQAGLRVEAV